MAGMSTSIEDLQAAVGVNGPPKGPVADEERVKRILDEMGAHVEPQRIITEPPISTSVGDLRMDAATARAHIIGGSTPTNADFQSMFAQAAPGLAPFHGSAAIPGAALPPQGKRSGAASGGDWKTLLANQLRAPIMVAAIVFLLSLPVVTGVLSRYAPWMYLGNGDISIAGLFVKSILAAALFFGYQTAATLWQ